MNLADTLAESASLAAELLALVDLPLCNDTVRVKVADVACSLSFEHWHSVRHLLAESLVPPALTVHRAQFESVLRSVWLTYTALDSDVVKLTANLDLESEQAAKNISQTLSMMDSLAKSGPKGRR